MALDTVALTKMLHTAMDDATRSEQSFKESIANLSNFRRGAVYTYVRHLKEQINLLRELREAEGRQFVERLKELKDGDFTLDRPASEDN